MAFLNVVYENKQVILPCSNLGPHPTGSFIPRNRTLEFVLKKPFSVKSMQRNRNFIWNLLCTTPKEGADTTSFHTCLCCCLPCSSTPCYRNNKPLLALWYGQPQYCRARERNWDVTLKELTQILPHQIGFAKCWACGEREPMVLC